MVRQFQLMFVGAALFGFFSALGTARDSAPLSSSADTPSADNLVRSLLLANLPREYENTKQWGKTKPRWDGLHISLEDLQIKTKRRWKEVNHGTWTRYKAIVVDPENQLFIQFAHLRQTPTRHAAFDLAIDAKLALSGRISEWRQGVQLYSFSTDADATIRMTMTCEAGLSFDSSKFPPDVLIAPRVISADLNLREFTLHRISEAEGPLVHKLGDVLRNVLQDEINDRRGKLVEKMNRAIDKQSGKLRLSVHDLAAGGWNRIVTPTAGVEAK